MDFLSMNTNASNPFYRVQPPSLEQLFCQAFMQALSMPRVDPSAQFLMDRQDWMQGNQSLQNHWQGFLGFGPGLNSSNGLGSFSQPLAFSQSNALLAGSVQSPDSSASAGSEEGQTPEATASPSKSSSSIAEQVAQLITPTDVKGVPRSRLVPKLSDTEAKRALVELTIPSDDPPLVRRRILNDAEHLSDEGALDLLATLNGTRMDRGGGDR